MFQYLKLNWRYLFGAAALHLLFAGLFAVLLTSKVLGKGKGWRIDFENPDPGGRPKAIGDGLTVEEPAVTRQCQDVLTHDRE